jgi:hypothetical protein
MISLFQASEPMGKNPIIQRFVTAKRDVPQVCFVLSRQDCDYPNASSVIMVYENTGTCINGEYVYEHKEVMLQ